MLYVHVAALQSLSHGYQQQRSWSDVEVLQQSDISELLNINDSFMCHVANYVCILTTERNILARDVNETLAYETETFGFWSETRS